MKDIFPNLNEEDKLLMEKLLADGKLYQKFGRRLQVILLRASGKRTTDIAEFLYLNPVTVSAYVKRYNEGGIDALLHNKTRKPGKAPVPQSKKDEICRIVCTEKPPNATQWQPEVASSISMLAKRVRLGTTTVHGILREAGLKPHLVEHFQFSNDPDFDKKLEDVTGLYLNPPDNAIVLCVDEKTQIQALERSQPILPLERNVPERQSHDYYRHGTTTLFAALDYLTGNVISDCNQTHKGADFVAFLKKLDKKCKKEKVLHIILDNYATHKTQEVKDYLASVPGRFELHFIPTHSSWLNLVERWFAEITNKRIRRESWESVDQLVHAIKDYVKSWNKNGKPFVWTKSAKQIQNKIAKAKAGTLTANV